MKSIIEHKPPRIAMLLIAVAFALHWFSPIGERFVVDASVIAVLLGMGGFLLMIAAWAQFRQRQVAICPTEPTALLITDGVYRVTRNPMYLGMVMMLTGLAFWYGTLPFVLATLAFFVVINRVFCPYEEQKLVATFGADYQNYRTRVGRWL